jgi:hypothetical protein
LLCHSSFSVRQASDGQTPKSNAKRQADSSMAKPILTFRRKSATNTASDIMMDINAYMSGYNNNNNSKKQFFLKEERLKYSS